MMMRRMNTRRTTKSSKGLHTRSKGWVRPRNPLRSTAPQREKLAGSENPSRRGSSIQSFNDPSLCLSLSLSLPAAAQAQNHNTRSSSSSANRAGGPSHAHAQAQAATAGGGSYPTATYLASSSTQQQHERRASAPNVASSSSNFGGGGGGGGGGTPAVGSPLRNSTSSTTQSSRHGVHQHDATAGGGRSVALSHTPEPIDEVAARAMASLLPRYSATMVDPPPAVAKKRRAVLEGIFAVLPSRKAETDWMLNNYFTRVDWAWHRTFSAVRYFSGRSNPTRKPIDTHILPTYPPLQCITSRPSSPNTKLTRRCGLKVVNTASIPSGWPTLP